MQTSWSKTTTLRKALLSLLVLFITFYGMPSQAAEIGALGDFSSEISYLYAGSNGNVLHAYLCGSEPDWKIPGLVFDEYLIPEYYYVDTYGFWGDDVEDNDFSVESGVQFRLDDAYKFFMFARNTEPNSFLPYPDGTVTRAGFVYQRFPYSLGLFYGDGSRNMARANYVLGFARYWRVDSTVEYNFGEDSFWTAKVDVERRFEDKPYSITGTCFLNSDNEATYGIGMKFYTP